VLWRAVRRSWHRADRHPRGDRDTDLTPVDLGSYSSRVTLMMGNAAIRRRARARSPRRRVEETGVSKVGSCSPTAASSTPRTPTPRSPLPNAVCLAEAMFGTIGSTARTTPPRSAAKFKAAASVLPPLLLLRPIVEVEFDSRPAGSRAARWIAHEHRPRAEPDAGARTGRGQRLLAIGEALMEGNVPPPAAEASSRAVHSSVGRDKTRLTA